MIFFLHISVQVQKRSSSRSTEHNEAEKKKFQKIRLTNILMAHKINLYSTKIIGASVRKAYFAYLINTKRRISETIG